MHELAVCQALLTQVERAARDARAGPLLRVVVRVGPLSGVEPGLLRRAFDVARLGGIATTAELSFEDAPVRVRCLDCGAESAAAANRLLCAACGAWRTRLIEGDELVLQRLEFGGLPCATPAAAT
jgi:hydrogenase nickel incorporation protein HypA/HybF